MLGDKPIELVTEADLLEMVAEAATEQRRLEFKRELPGGAEKDTREFLADVSSMANAIGGYIVYGMSECSGVADSVCGVKSADPDSEILRLQQKLISGLRPRIPQVFFHAVRLSSTGHCIVAEIRSSWIAPHMVAFRGSSRFHTRDSNGKHQMDVDELRLAFTQGASRKGQLDDFRAERLSMLVADRGQVSVGANPMYVIHLIPMGQLATSDSRDATRSHCELGHLPLVYQYGQLSRYNVDGYLTIGSRRGGWYEGYTQLYRSGAFEAVTSNLTHESDAPRMWPGLVLVEQSWMFMQAAWQLLKDRSLDGPATVMLSLVGAKDTVLADGSRRHGPGFDREVIQVPAALCDGLDDLAQATGEALDMLWNAAGYASMPHAYHEKLV